MKRLRRLTKGTAFEVRRRIMESAPRVWRLEDFSELPPLAVCQALSRLAKEKELVRLSKGVYYHGSEGTFGASIPNPALLMKLARRTKPIFPTGIAAANLLGLSTQNPAKVEVATPAASLPRKLIGEDTTVRTRRPAFWASLSAEDAAILEFLRSRGETSDADPDEMLKKLLTLMSERGRFARLAAAAETEPPRVRAMLGALGQALGKKERVLGPLRQSLNPLSQFDFGALSLLETAMDWQVRENVQ